MRTSIRRATAADISQMVALLLLDARARHALNPSVWPVDAETESRIEKNLRKTLEAADAGTKEAWLLAEANGRLDGVAHAMIVQPPPIYDIVAGPPGLFLDECFVRDDAPPETAEGLLLAMEAALRDRGAAGLIASCPAGGPWRALYERHGYEQVTLYMAKDGFRRGAPPAGVRPARPDDLPEIVSRSAEHRRMLQTLNDRFWHIHPQADARFEAWMRFSLTLTDREMFVAEEADGVNGYVIAQPIASLLVPPAHDIAGTGVIDDFYSRDLASATSLSNGGASASALLAAAEDVFARRGFAAALTVCPAAWTSKRMLLERQGYRTAKLWMLKR